MSSSTPQIFRVGTRSLLIELDNLEQSMTWHAALTAEPASGQIEIIAAAKTVLLKFRSQSAAHNAAEALRSFQPGNVDLGESKNITIDVVYDGEDLHDAAAHLGLSADALIKAHTGQQWTAAFGGFAPGFTYCVPADQHSDVDWNMPRRSSPRTEVPAGAVALASNFSAVYPRKSPGGWQLIGHTDIPMWNTDNQPPALLSPGDTVTYRAVREAVDVASTNKNEATQAATPRVPGFPVATLDDAGLQTLFQDYGRGGHGDMGVTASGAVDRSSAWAANAVVGNESSAAVLENIGGLTLTAAVDAVFAVTGAIAPISLDGRPVDLARPLAVNAGQKLSIGAATSGMRNYVAVRGGFAAETVLDSSATDILSGLGPAPISSGSKLKKADRVKGSVDPHVVNPYEPTSTLRCVAGPRDDWFTAEELQRFTELEWKVSGQSNRVGLRLTLNDGDQPLERKNTSELASEGVVAGSIQVPPNGLPVVFLADHPVTGGYPVIATVISEDMDKAGQLPPGSSVHFSFIDPDDAPTTSLRSQTPPSNTAHPSTTEKDSQHD